jgi:hypothetical protein
MLRYFVEGGGLISYGYDVIEQFRNAAGYADRILKGEKPADQAMSAILALLRYHRIAPPSTGAGGIWALDLLAPEARIRTVVT